MTIGWWISLQDTIRQDRYPCQITLFIITVKLKCNALISLLLCHVYCESPVINQPLKLCFYDLVKLAPPILIPALNSKIRHASCTKYDHIHDASELGGSCLAFSLLLSAVTALGCLLNCPITKAGWNSDPNKKLCWRAITLLCVHTFLLTSGDNWMCAHPLCGTCWSLWFTLVLQNDTGNVSVWPGLCVTVWALFRSFKGMIQITYVWVAGWCATPWLHTPSCAHFFCFSVGCSDPSWLDSVADPVWLTAS